MDGNRQNNSPTNLVLVCSSCRRHFFFRFNSEEIFVLKVRGLSNAEIGRILGISRERVRQLYKRQRVEVSKSPKAMIDALVKRAMQRQETLIKEQKLNERWLVGKEMDLWEQRQSLNRRTLREVKEELRKQEEELEKERLRMRKTRIRRISEKRMREIIISEIDKASSRKGGKRR